MSTRHLVDPELAEYLGLLPGLATNEQMLPAVRQAVAELSAGVSDILVPGVEVSTGAVPGPDTGSTVGVEISTPTGVGGPRPVLIWLHGGGYVLGSATQERPRAGAIVSAWGGVVVAVDYRLAPEAHYPAAVEDCYAVLRWLVEHAADLGIDPARIAVGGESAGAGLAAAFALLVRDRGEFALRFQALVYPMLDDRTVTQADANAYTGEFVWTRDNNRFGWTSMLGAEPGGTAVPATAAAGRAEDLSGLPPAFVAVGSLDLFLDEDVDYARRLLRAGVPTELHVYPGAFHGFWLAEGTTIAARLQGEVVAALARATAPTVDEPTQAPGGARG